LGRLSYKQIRQNAATNEVLFDFFGPAAQCQQVYCVKLFMWRTFDGVAKALGKHANQIK